MSSIRLSDLDWTCVQQRIDAIRADQARVAREQAREVVAAAAVRRQEAPPAGADGRPRQRAMGGDRGVVAAAAVRRSETRCPWRMTAGWCGRRRRASAVYRGRPSRSTRRARLRHDCEMRRTRQGRRACNMVARSGRAMRSRR
ncbi:unnamed protein product [Linum trigynum]|uniref:Uncharacterized protein n=1 Tax=Linum trigynum TaxID=586398 RepID=A0AAV2GND6_9ROSI